jgi:hypothetical protein
MTTVQDRKNFAWLANVLLEMLPNEESDRMGPIHVPRNYREANLYCLKGTNSIMKSMPTPHMEVISRDKGKDQHVVVDPIDTIHLLFALLPLDVIESIPVVTAEMEPPDNTTGECSSYFESAAFMQAMKQAIDALNASQMIKRRTFSPASNSGQMAGTQTQRSKIAMVSGPWFGPL